MMPDPNDDPLDAMAEGRAVRLVRRPETFDATSGKPVDPRNLIDAAALVQRLQDFAMGEPGVTMFDGQLAAARLLLDRVVPVNQPPVAVMNVNFTLSVPPKQAVAEPVSVTQHGEGQHAKLRAH